MALYTQPMNQQKANATQPTAQKKQSQIKSGVVNPYSPANATTGQGFSSTPQRPAPMRAWGMPGQKQHAGQPAHPTGAPKPSGYIGPTQDKWGDKYSWQQKREITDLRDSLRDDTGKLDWMAYTDARNQMTGGWADTRQQEEDARRLKQWKDSLGGGSAWGDFSLTGATIDDIDPAVEGDQKGFRKFSDMSEEELQEYRDKYNVGNEWLFGDKYGDYWETNEWSPEAEKQRIYDQWYRQTRMGEGSGYDPKDLYEAGLISEEEMMKQVDQLQDIGSWDMIYSGAKHSGGSGIGAGQWSIRPTGGQQFYAGGGYVEPKGYAGGGPARGTDTVPAMLTPGEFVVSRPAVQKIGLQNLMRMNAAGGGTNVPTTTSGVTYAKGGGPIRPSPPAAPPFGTPAPKPPVAPTPPPASVPTPNLRYGSKPFQGSNNAFLANLSSQYQAKMDAANRENEKRYKNILGQYGDLHARTMGSYDQLGQDQIAESRRMYDQSLAGMNARLGARGLSGTTVGASLQHGVDRGYQDAVKGIQEASAVRKATADADLMRAKLAFMERREDVQPDFSNLVNLSQSMAAGGYGAGYGGMAGAGARGSGGYTGSGMSSGDYRRWLRGAEGGFYGGERNKRLGKRRGEFLEDYWKDWNKSNPIGNYRTKSKPERWGKFPNKKPAISAGKEALARWESDYADWISQHIAKDAAEGKEAWKYAQQFMDLMNNEAISAPIYNPDQ